MVFTVISQRENLFGKEFPEYTISMNTQSMKEDVFKKNRLNLLLTWLILLVPHLSADCTSQLCFDRSFHA